MEWSQESLGYPLKKDEDGNVLTHRGNPIVRGFNPAQQRHRRLVSTKDKAILKAENIKHYFDDSKYKMMNYMSELGPPTKYNSDLTKKQWKRIQKA